jgi:hypothetical protein
MLDDSSAEPRGHHKKQNVLVLLSAASGCTLAFPLHACSSAVALNVTEFHCC